MPDGETCLHDAGHERRAGNTRAPLFPSVICQTSLLVHSLLGPSLPGPYSAGWAAVRGAAAGTRISPGRTNTDSVVSVAAMAST